MTRRLETRHSAGAAHLGLLAGTIALVAAALACQAQPVPNVQGEPAQPAPAASAPASPASSPAPAPNAAAPNAGSQVGLAKYEEPNTALSGAPAPGAAPPPNVAPHATADAPAQGKGQTVQGTVVAEEPFSVWLQAESPVAAGSPATVEAVLVAKPPYHCNADYPHKFKLGTAPAGLTYPEPTVKGAKVTPERSVLAIPVRAQAAGKATVSGTLQFSVCNDERCLVEKRELALNLEVK
jgi:hypothetical protein